MARLATFRYYSRKMLLALIIGYVANLLLVIVSVALLGNINAASGDTRDILNTLINMGALLFISQAIFVLIYDWRGVVTLRGWTRSRAWRESQLGNLTLLFVILYLCFPPVMLPIYLLRVASGRREAEEQKKLAMKRHIAIMEAQLGILPPTNGTCHACHKALQAEAEFCQYCGVPVVERPKVCSSCEATALPDAKWCPQCGASLR